MTTFEIKINSLTEQAIQNFSLTDTAIAELRDKYMPLKINGVDDKDGYISVRTARLDIKSKRVEVDKKRKQLTEDARKHVNAVNDYAKNIISELEKIESHLGKQESAVDDEKERIKHEAANAKAYKLQARIQTMFEVGFKFNGKEYTCSVGEFTCIYTPIDLDSQSDEIFNQNINVAREMVALNIRKEAEKQAAIDKQREIEDAERIAHQAQIQADREALAKERAELQAEKDRLAAIAQAAADKQKEADDFEAAKLAAEQRRADEFKKDLKPVSVSITNKADETVFVQIEPFTNYVHSEEVKAQLADKFYGIDPAKAGADKTVYQPSQCSCCATTGLEMIVHLTPDPNEFPIAMYCATCTNRIFANLFINAPFILREAIDYVQSTL